MDSNIIKYNEVSIKEDDRIILENLCFELNKGEMTYIIGEVGSGKSTFLKSLYAEKQIFSGQAFVNGFNLINIPRKNVSKLRRSMGLVFQNYELLNDRNVEKNIRFAAECTNRKDKKEIRDKINSLAEEAGIDNILHKMPYELSGGEKQLVSIARAVMNKPPLLIADEPTTNLDNHNRNKILQFINKLKNKGTAIIIATHDENMIAKFPAKTFRIIAKKLEERS